MKANAAPPTAWHASHASSLKCAPQQRRSSQTEGGSVGGGIGGGGEPSAGGRRSHMVRHISGSRLACAESNALQMAEKKQLGLGLGLGLG